MFLKHCNINFQNAQVSMLGATCTKKWFSCKKGNVTVFGRLHYIKDNSQMNSHFHSSFSLKKKLAIKIKFIKYMQSFFSDCT